MLKWYWSSRDLPELSGFSEEEREQIWIRALRLAPFRWQPWVFALVGLAAWEVLRYYWALQRAEMLFGQQGGRRICGLLAILIAGAIYRQTNFRIVRRYIPLALPGHCASCGYDLTHHVADKCPECGASTAVAPTAVAPTPPPPQRLWSERNWFGAAVLYGVLLVALTFLFMIGCIFYLLISSRDR